LLSGGYVLTYSFQRDFPQSSCPSKRFCVFTLSPSLCRFFPPPYTQVVDVSRLPGTLSVSGLRYKVSRRPPFFFLFQFDVVPPSLILMHSLLPIQGDSFVLWLLSCFQKGSIWPPAYFLISKVRKSPLLAPFLG